MTLAAIFIFSLCLAGVGYAYAVYPLIIATLARLFGRTAPRPSSPDQNLPTATLLISAYNEEPVIAQRIQDALAMDYPKDRMQIIVASDGSSDRTAEIVSQFADRGVRLINPGQRRGKSAVLNASIADITTELVFLSDANTLLRQRRRPQHRRRLVLATPSGDPRRLRQALADRCRHRQERGRHVLEVRNFPQKM